MSTRRLPVRVACALGCTLLGVGTAVPSVLLHQRWWGLLLAAVTLMALLLALPRGWHTRLALSLGWGAGVLGLALPGPGGDVLVPNGLPGYLLLAWAFVLLVTSMVTMPGRSRTPPRMSP